MLIFLKLFFSSLLKIASNYFIPFWAGIMSFIVFHDFIDKNISIRIPFLSKTEMSESVDRLGQLILGAQEMTETKLMLIYFILFSTIIIGTAVSYSPIAGGFAWGIILCIIEYIIIACCCYAEWQTTIFANFGIIIERVVDFEDLRIIFENLCLTHLCIEPGMNPCKMARDCINGHELEGKLMEEMIKHIWDVTEDYDSWAGLAGQYVDKIGPRHTGFTHWYWWYDVWPDPRLQPPEITQNLYGKEPFWSDCFFMGLGVVAAYGLCTLILNMTIY